MKLEVEILGGYPRSDRLRRVMRSVEEKGEAPDFDLSRILYEDTLIVVGAQLASGMTRVVDGMLDWHDPLRPFVEAWRGVAIGGLQRWFDNNFFYRVPVFTDLPDVQRYVLAPRVLNLKQLGVGKVKAVLPGPYTFTKLSANRSGRGFWELLDAVTEVLAKEVSAAIAAGADMVQVDEPMLGDIDAEPGEVKEVVERINELSSKAHGRLRVAVAYRPPAPEVYRALEGLRIDGFVMDVVDLPDKALQLIGENVYGRTVGVGLLQARNIYRDPYSRFREMALKALEAAEKGGAETLLVTTSAWLDLIPFTRAIEKTRLLGCYAERLAEEQGLEKL